MNTEEYQALLQGLPDYSDTHHPIVETFQAYMQHNKNNKYTEKAVQRFNYKYRGCYDSELDFSKDKLDRLISFYCKNSLRPFITLDYNKYHTALFNSGRYYSLKDKKGNSHIFKKEIRK